MKHLYIYILILIATATSADNTNRCLTNYFSTQNNQLMDKGKKPVRNSKSEIKKIFNLDGKRICNINECETIHYCNGLCRRHYDKRRRKGDVLAPDRVVRKGCLILKCNEPHSCHGYCAKHMGRFYRTGKYTIEEKTTNAQWVRMNVSYGKDDCLIPPFEKGRGKPQTIKVNGNDFNASRYMCILAHENPPTNKHQAAHKCGKGHLNCLNPKHLYWATPSENQMDRVKHRTDIRGEKHPFSKLMNEDVFQIIELVNIMSRTEVANIYGVDNSVINSILRGKSWSWLTGIKYKEKTYESGKRGVYWSKTSRKWVATIKHKRKVYPLGRFTVLKDAIEARKAGEIKYWGDNKGIFKKER